MRIDEERWEEYFTPSKREMKHERKQISAKDRSKYKKTDQAKAEIKKLKDQEEGLKLLSSSPDQVKKGVVALIHSQDFYVLIDGAMELARLRGALKLKQEQEKNLVIVGDEVIVQRQEDNTYIVEAVLPRRSILCRQDNLNRVRRHLIAANIDQVLITTSIVNPHLRPTIIDRYIIAAQKGGMRPAVIINKIDLRDQADENELELLKLCQKIYPQLGIPVVSISTVTQEGIDELLPLMKSSISVFSGQSGTGKSSLINAITGLSLKVGETVEKTRKGSHTTTFAQLLALPGDGMCIDTPGIKSFGIWDLKKEDIRSGFTEIAELGAGCQFSDCWHRGEEGCRVLQALEEGDSRLHPLRYDSYLALLDEIEEKRRRR